ncbi:MAG: hypothetical protein RJA70_4688 [Pseudomonadota bacterium]|jgi:DNA-binding response OmpR family regulator
MPVEASPSRSATAQGRERALVVDDDDHVRVLVQRILATAFAAVDAAHNAAQGVAALQGQAYDVVVTDLTMPGASGLTVVREARIRAPEAAVLVITGFADQDDEAQIQQLGAELLRKPFGVGELLAAIARAQASARLSPAEG